MCDDDKKKVAVIGIWTGQDLALSEALAAMLKDSYIEAHIVPLDIQSTVLEPECHSAAASIVWSRLEHESFREAYKFRIQRYHRKLPRNGSALLDWNRKLKWQPRFFSGPSRRSHFSQSQLRLSQVLSWPPATPGRLRRDSSRGLLSH